MNVIIASIFRDSASYLDRYIAQVADLRTVLERQGDTLSAVWGEGDSIDRTAVLLAEKARKAGLTFDLVDVSHGGPKFGSVNVDQRWRQISYCCNTVLDRVPEDADIVIYVESDLIWTPDTMLNLMQWPLSNNDFPAVAPMSMAHGEEPARFYDTWGHRAFGEPFQPFAPFHAMLTPSPILMKLDSAGSCIVMRNEVARVARFDPPEQGIVGFGSSIAGCGYSLWLDPSQSVWHP